MTTRQTQYANGKKSVPVGKHAGQDVGFLASYDIVSGQDAALVAAADRVEMFILPAGHVINNMILLGVSGAVGTANVGLMSGTAGDPSNARTVGSEFFVAASTNAAVTRMVEPGGFVVPAVDYDRGVGITISADITQGAGRYLRLVVKMAPNP